MFHRLKKRMFDFIVGVVEIDTTTALECEVTRRLFEVQILNKHQRGRKTRP